MKSEINFYQADETIVKSLAPLLLKILEEKKKVTIFCQDQDQIKEIDGSLWSYGRNKFIPHVTVFDKDFDFARQPIVISNEEKNINESDYLVFLNEPSSAFISKFSRVFYFFEERNLSKAKDLAQKLNPANSYKKDDGKWIKFKF